MFVKRMAALVAATVLLAGGAAPVLHSPLPAQLRFANRLTGTVTWSVAVNGTVAFADVAPGTSTAYQPVSDTVRQLTLRRSGSDSALASTNYQFVAGSYYTVAATAGNGVRPVLSVERDRPPGDSTPTH
jgi:hypothetical protein